MKTYVFIGLGFIVLLLLLLGSFYIYEERVYLFQTRATYQIASQENSLAVSVPACVPATGEDITRVYVYCLNGRGLGEPNMNVSVYPTNDANGLKIVPVQGSTDGVGKAMFDITSNTEGTFDVTITCADTVITRDHQICFTKP